MSIFNQRLNIYGLYKMVILSIILQLHIIFLSTHRKKSHKKMQEPNKFFNTETEPAIDSNLNSQIKKKHDFSAYVSNLDHHINKAMGYQNKVLSRKKNNLIQTLQKMKDQIYRESQKTRKMMEFFQANCQKILADDINKWGSNRQFFTKIVDLYDYKIKQKQAQVAMKKSEIQRKTKHLKQLLRNSRKAYTVEQLTQKLVSQKKQRSLSKNKGFGDEATTRITRVKTQVSLPSLVQAGRVKTMADSEQGEIKNYMKPIKTQKNLSDPTTRENLLQILNWYKAQKEEYNWFEKLVFVDRNFKKIVQAIICEDG